MDARGRLRQGLGLCSRRQERGAVGLGETHIRAARGSTSEDKSTAGSRRDLGRQQGRREQLVLGTAGRQTPGLQVPVLKAWAQAGGPEEVGSWTG